MNGMSSGAIAQMVGSFAGMLQMMGIGRAPYGAGNSGMQAEGMVGGAMSRGMGTFGPMMGGAASMLGLDPLGLGMRAGMGAFNMGAGVTGIGMAGMGAFAGAGAVGMGAHFVGQQMMQGAGNTMALNNSLRQNFNFQTPNGQGFSRGDMTAIGGTLQSMTHQVGAGGEVSSFGELSRLASNMGRMGLGTGVRDAQEFSKKFKEMVGTLKTVATELGTSLEAAQELLVASKGSGIFKKVDQLKYSGTIRNLGLSGGLATSELTAMGNIGSQIARSVGGLGRQGALGGMGALGIVGTANKMGVLSEEDIYNATGQTGAEGRQAMATEMMQTTGNFLKTGKGRFFMASMAGKDGKLDMNVVNEYMSGGGFTVGETRDKAHQNLAGIGRANFIRNEGRLRGAIMEQMKGMTPALALMQWAQGKGISIDDMDDRSMLFAQRHLGMGRDELDSTIKMAQNLPDIMRKQREVGRDDEYNQSKAQYTKSRDVRVRLDQIREKVQGKLQAIGADIFSAGSDFIEGAMNRILGQFDTYASKNLQEVANNAKFGGQGNREQFTRMFGTQQGVMGMSSKEISQAADRVELMGGFHKGDPTQQAEASRLAKLASNANFGGASIDVLQYSEHHKADLLKAYAGGIALRQGEERTQSVRAHLETEAAKGDTGAQHMLIQMETNPEAVVGAMERTMGLSKEAQLGQTFEKGKPFGGKGGYSTESDQNRAFGRSLTSASRDENILAQGAFSKSAVVATATYFASSLFTGQGRSELSESIWKSGMDTAEKLSEGGVRNDSIGQALRDTSTHDLMRRMAVGEDNQAGNLRMSELASKKDRSPFETGQLSILKMTSFGKRYADLSRTNDKVGIAALVAEAGKDEVLKAAMGNTGISEGVLEKWRSGVGGLIGEQSRIDRDTLADKWQKEGDRGLEYMKRSDVGIMEMDKKTGKWGLSSKTQQELASVKDTANGEQATKLALQLVEKQSRLGEITGTGAEQDEARSHALQNIVDDSGQLTRTLGNMGVADLRKWAAGMAGTEGGDRALDVIGMKQRLTGIQKKTKDGKGENIGATAARYLGLDLGKEGEGALKGLTADRSATVLGRTLELTKEQQSELTNTLGAVQRGDKGAAVKLEEFKKTLTVDQQKKLGSGGKDAQSDIAKNTADSALYLKTIVTSNDSMVQRLGELKAGFETKVNPDKFVGPTQ